MTGSRPVTRQLIEVQQRVGGSVLEVQGVPLAQTRSYGIVPGPEQEPRLCSVAQIVEKPAPEVASPALGVAGRYVLSPRMSERLARQECGVGGESQLTEAIITLAASDPDPNYAATRAFYAALGFLPLEELPQVWGPENPCLLLVRTL